MSFPHEAVPDGAVFAPHHAYVGAALALLACALVWDNYRHTEPALATGGLVVSLFGFALVWRFYPVTGALLSVLGLLLAGVALLVPMSPWSRYPTLPHAVALVGVLVALDDVLEHALGVATPLDTVWRHVAPVVP